MSQRPGRAARPAELCPVHQRVSGWVPGQDHAQVAVQSPIGSYGRQPTNVSLSLKSIEEQTAPWVMIEDGQQYDVLTAMGFADRCEQMIPTFWFHFSPESQAPFQLSMKYSVDVLGLHTRLPTPEP